ncbi:MAG: RNA polymerase sigma factor [Proteobacteria bacterium]|nr:RNA polymerase sigma factor [Pseudomonadota bacterium]
MSEIFERFKVREPFLRAFIRRFFRTKAMVDDICQETILRALEAEQARKIDTPDAFLFGVARNVVRKQLEQQSNSIIDFVDEIAADGDSDTRPTIEEEIDSQKRMARFAEAVARLPKQCRRVFILKKVYGYSHKEISAELGLSISTIENQVSTGMKRCLDQLDEKTGDMVLLRNDPKSDER